jgi:catechol 2,3-dioxygenase-like lactoylglutathione lyase family enzyme
MPIETLDHYSVRTTDVDATRDFYQDVVGLTVGPRPDFPFPGAWLYQNDKAVVHIIGIDAKDSSGLRDYLGERKASAGTGALDHVAFTATGIDAMRAHLNARDAHFIERDVPGMALKQIFLTDPNGVTIELNFRVD